MDTISNWLKRNKASHISKIELSLIPDSSDGPACIQICMIFDRSLLYDNNAPYNPNYAEVSNLRFINLFEVSDEKIIEALDSMYEQGLAMRTKINKEFGY